MLNQWSIAPFTSTYTLINALQYTYYIHRDEDFQPRLAKKPDYDTILEENENFEILEKPSYNGRSLTQVDKYMSIF